MTEKLRELKPDYSQDVLDALVRLKGAFNSAGLDYPTRIVVSKRAFDWFKYFASNSDGFRRNLNEDGILEMSFFGMEIDNKNLTKENE